MYLLCFFIGSKLLIESFITISSMTLVVFHRYIKAKKNSLLLYLKRSKELYSFCFI